MRGIKISTAPERPPPPPPPSPPSKRRSSRFHQQEEKESEPSAVETLVAALQNTPTKEAYAGIKRGLVAESSKSSDGR